MSQIYKAASSVTPPTVATSYTTDVNSPAVPALNVLQVIGNDTITNDDDGVYTDGSSGGNTLTVFLSNRTSASLTTSDGAGQTQTAVLMTPTNATSLTFRMYLTAYDTINNEAIGGEQVGLARKSGGVAAVVGTNDTFDEYDAALAANDWEVQASGGNLILSVTGIAGRTINWKAIFQYTQVA